MSVRGWDEFPDVFKTVGVAVVVDGSETYQIYTLYRSSRKRKVGFSNASRDKPKSLKQVVTAPLSNDWH